MAREDLHVGVREGGEQRGEACTSGGGEGGGQGVKLALHTHFKTETLMKMPSLTQKSSVNKKTHTKLLTVSP